MSYTLEEYRALADLLLFYACGINGRGEKDPVYVSVTEGRDTTPGYSSCADLGHWLHYRLGLRGSWINRKEHKGWKVGMNVSRLAYSPIADSFPQEPYECGDIGIIWSLPDTTDAHVLVFRGALPSGYATAEYGQPGGALKDRKVVGGLIGKRRIHRILRLQEAIDTCAGSGALVEPDKKILRLAIDYCNPYFAGEILDHAEKLLARPWAL